MYSVPLDKLQSQSEQYSGNVGPQQGEECLLLSTVGTAAYRNMPAPTYPLSDSAATGQDLVKCHFSRLTAKLKALLLRGVFSRCVSAEL